MKKVNILPIPLGNRPSRPSVISPGDRYGRLTVVREAGRDRGQNRVYYCRCDCGGVAYAAAGDLRKPPKRPGRIVSCGCLRREVGRSQPQVYSKEDIIAAIRKDARHRGDFASQQEWIREKKQPSPWVMKDRFGTWSKAIEAAGFTPRLTGQTRAAMKNKEYRRRNRQMVTGGRRKAQ